jgi:glyoxylase-like metal-dependent hydrolase (beta-lactamase superfamily II)
MWMAPHTFAEKGGQSSVHVQPADEAARRDASAALLACPTGSIGGPAVAVDFPRPVSGVEGVWHMGFHDERSFGAASWLVRTEAGNVMVDVPRFVPRLMRGVEALGGVDHIVLTHRDDVAAHAKWHAHFGAPRSIHVDDDRIGADAPLGGDRAVDGRVAGLAWTHVPGHTRGSVVFRRGDVLFTGDHLAARDDAGTRGLTAFRRACWYDWNEQTRSMERLVHLPVRHVLPGHGAPWHGDVAGYQAAMARLVAWMKTV